MKKFILSLCLAFSIAGCSGGSNEVVLPENAGALPPEDAAMGAGGNDSMSAPPIPMD